MTTQGLLSGRTVWIVFAAYCLFLIAIARYTTWKEKRDAGRVDLQGGRFKWPVMVMTYIASCMSVWVFFAGPGAYYRYGLGYFFSEMCIYSMFPIICYFTMTKVWLVNPGMLQISSRGSPFGRAGASAPERASQF